MSQQALVNGRYVQVGEITRVGVLVTFVTVVLCAFPRTTAQFILVPLLLLAAAKLRVFLVRVPLLVVAAASLGLITAAAFRYSHVTLANGAFLVAALDEQDLQQQSKIYRDKMRRVVGRGAETLVGLHSKRITQASEARELLNRFPQVGGIIWGNMRWMTASLQYYAPLSFSSFSDTSVARDFLARHGVADLLIVRSIPSIGLSDADQRATVAFLARTSKLWRDVPRVLAPEQDRAEFDSTAVVLSRTRARWTSVAHVSFPLWLAGTRHLVRALEKPELDFGELRCAVVRLKQASKLSRGGKSPQLEAAVRSNYALALLLYADASPRRKRLKDAAIRHAVAAARLQKKWVEGAAVAQHNLLALGVESATMGAHAKPRR